MADTQGTIGFGRGTAMMLNIVLGAGLLTLPGLAAGVAGAAAPLVWLSCAVAAIPLLAVFAIMGRDHASGGGIADWAQKAFGDYAYRPATLIFLGAVSVGLPSIAITGGHYASGVVGLDPHLLALLLILGAAAGNLVSPERAARFNAIIASGLLAVMVGLAVLGWMVVAPAPLARAGDAIAAFEPGAFGLAFMMIFFAFTGWEVAANLGGDFRRPRRDVPRAIAASFLIATALYLVLALIVAGAGPAAATEAPFAAIFGERFGPGAVAIVGLIAVLLIFANLSAAIWAVSRMVASAAAEGILPRALARRRREVPMAAVMATVATLGLVTLVSAGGLVDLGGLLAAAGLNFLLLYGLAALSLAVVSQRAGHRVVAGTALCVTTLLVATRPVETLLYPAVLIAAGLLLALLRGFRKRRGALAASGAG